MAKQTRIAPTKSSPATMSIEDAARELGIGRHTAYRCAKQGQIPTIRLGRRILVPRAKLEALLRADQPVALPPDWEDRR
jgi:excisionase family DNA binding protein